MYTPAHSNTMAIYKDVPQQIRLLLQSAPKTGKTYAATTFPNPVFLNFDRGLGAHSGNADIVEVPFWNLDFVKKITPNDLSRKTLVTQWLKTEGQKMESDQTLVLDGSTGLQNAFDAWSKANPTYSARTGKLDEFAHWSNKVEYFAEVCESFKTLKCHVIYISHETLDRGKDGELNGKVRTLLTGQFGDQLASHFTDSFRQHAFAKPAQLPDANKVMSLYGMTPAEYQEMLNSFTTNTVYVWQTQSDDVANCGSSSLVGQPRFIKADYATFCKYLRKK